MIADVCSENYTPGKYGPGFNHYFHSHVFELLLRLRANYFWPAEWGSMFCVDDTANQPLADAYGIVLGSSHTGIYTLFLPIGNWLMMRRTNAARL